MIEIVFGESACGSLKIAQTYGKGKYRGSAVSVFMRHEDGSVPSSDEMKEAQIQAQEQEHIAWENAIPLGGKSSDVYCFDMALSVGDISDNGIGEQRKNVFKKMLSVCFVEDLDYQVEEKIQKIKTTLTSVIERYVAGEEIRICNGKTYWGVGIDADIIKASIQALVVAVNKLPEIAESQSCKDERLLEITNYIYANYKDVTLDDLSEKFFLSKPYLSKYIKEKSGLTFGDILKQVRMKKARALLKSSSMTVENIALTVGYQNVEHFNRLFKKAYNITPVQFRNQK